MINDINDSNVLIKLKLSFLHPLIYRPISLVPVKLNYVFWFFVGAGGRDG